MRPIQEFEPGPLTQNFLDNLIVTWPHRFVERRINRDEDLSTDDPYKEWVQLQKDKKEYVCARKRVRCIKLSIEKEEEVLIHGL